MVRMVRKVFSNFSNRVAMRLNSLILQKKTRQVSLLVQIHCRAPAWTIAPRRNNRDTVLIKNYRNYLIGIIRFISDGELRRKAIDHHLIHDAVMHVAPVEFEMQ